MPRLEYADVRGLEGIKEATVNVNGTDINVAIVHGTANAAKLLNAIRAGEKTYHFIEVMGCPGGCVTGGGQPIVDARTRYYVDRVPRALPQHTARMNPWPYARAIRTQRCRSFMPSSLASQIRILRTSCCIPPMWTGARKHKR